MRQVETRQAICEGCLPLDFGATAQLNWKDFQPKVSPRGRQPEPQTINAERSSQRRKGQEEERCDQPPHPRARPSLPNLPTGQPCRQHEYDCEQAIENNCQRSSQQSNSRLIGVASLFGKGDAQSDENAETNQHQQYICKANDRSKILRSQSRELCGGRLRSCGAHSTAELETMKAKAIRLRFR